MIDKRGDRRAVPEGWQRIRKRIYERDKGICCVCSRSIPLAEYQCGHIVDRMNGGSDEDCNLVVMCAWCNQMKPPHKTEQEFVSWVRKGGPTGSMFEQCSREMEAVLTAYRDAMAVEAGFGSWDELVEVALSNDRRALHG